MSEPLALDHLREWLGRSETLHDTLSPWTARALAGPSVA